MRSAYRQLAETIVVLTNDLVRARGHWKKARGLFGPTETTRVPNDPDWFAP